MGSSHQQTVDEVAGEKYSSVIKGTVNASSDKETRTASFPATPAFKGYDPKKEFLKLVMNKKVKDPDGSDSSGLDHFGFDSEYYRHYPESPKYDDVKTGTKGRPGTAFTPNLASPQDGVNPKSITKKVTLKEKESVTPFVGEGTSVAPDAPSKRIRKDSVERIKSLADVSS